MEKKGEKGDYSPVLGATKAKERVERVANRSKDMARRVESSGEKEKVDSRFASWVGNFTKRDGFTDKESSVV